jgi:type I restriction enzyme, S subunit
VLKASRPYPKVKPSGFDWLGDIPSHWAVHRLSNVCGFASGKAHEQFVQSNGIHVCVNARFVSTDGRTRKYSTKNLSPAQRGDVLMVMSDLPNGRALAKAFYVENDVSYAVNQRVCALSARRDLSPKFLFYFANRNHFLLRNDDGCNQTHLPNSAFKTMPTLLPPFEEQEAIVRFLDWANGRLERVIRGKRKVIALLTEQKQAIIHRAVTRGLDPTVPLKPSGIPWLGDIPAHWEAQRLKAVCRVQGGFAFPAASFGESGVPVVRMSNLKRGFIDLNGTVRVPQNAGFDTFLLRTGDVLYGLSGSVGQTGSLGNFAIVSDQGFKSTTLTSQVPFWFS